MNQTFGPETQHTLRIVHFYKGKYCLTSEVDACRRLGDVSCRCIHQPTVQARLEDEMLTQLRLTETGNDFNQCSAANISSIVLPNSDFQQAFFNGGNVLPLMCGEWVFLTDLVNSKLRSNFMHFMPSTD